MKNKIQLNKFDRVKLMTLLICSSLLTGCAGLMRTDYQAPHVEIPVSWQQQKVTQEVSIDPWWKSFDDEKLNNYIDQVLTTNNDLALATLTLQKAD